MVRAEKEPVRVLRVVVLRVIARDSNSLCLSASTIAAERRAHHVLADHIDLARSRKLFVARLARSVTFDDMVRVERAADHVDVELGDDVLDIDGRDIC